MYLLRKHEGSLWATAFLIVVVACGRDRRRDHIPGLLRQRAIELCGQAIGRALLREGDPRLRQAETAAADAAGGYRVQARLEGVSGWQYVECQLVEHEGVLEISGVSLSEW